MSEIWLDDSELKARKEFCNCGNLMKLESLSRHEFHEGDVPDYTYTIQVFKILTCPVCNSATVLLYRAVGDRGEDSEEIESGVPPCHRYTQQILYAPKKQLHPVIPIPISEVINQAQAVLASSPRASFILCRAVLEEVCNDFEIPSEDISKNGKPYFINLHKRLSELFKREELPEDLQEIIQGIKDLGNEGAHSNHATFERQVQFQEAENLLTLVKYALERLYVDKIRQREATETLNKLKGRVLPSQQ